MLACAETCKQACDFVYTDCGGNGVGPSPGQTAEDVRMVCYDDCQAAEEDARLDWAYCIDEAQGGLTAQEKARDDEALGEACASAVECGESPCPNGLTGVTNTTEECG